MKSESGVMRQLNSTRCARLTWLSARATPVQLVRALGRVARRVHEGGCAATVSQRMSVRRTVQRSFLGRIAQPR